MVKFSIIMRLDFNVIGLFIFSLLLLNSFITLKCFYLLKFLFENKKSLEVFWKITTLRFVWKIKLNYLIVRNNCFYFLPWNFEHEKN
jgi:hypothetical protein